MEMSALGPDKERLEGNNNRPRISYLTTYCSNGPPVQDNEGWEGEEVDVVGHSSGSSDEEGSDEDSESWGEDTKCSLADEDDGEALKESSDDHSEDDDHTEDYQMPKGHTSEEECELERLPTRSENEGLRSTKRRKVSQHDAKWLQMLEKLKEYRKENGHCNVPQGYSANKKLGSWVHNQRNQCRLRQQGKQSSMTDERIAALERIGFKWSLAVPRTESVWQVRLGELRDYKSKHGNCNVPRECSKNKQLGRWVDTQRGHYWLRQQGKQSSMTDERIAALNSMGFKWTLAEPRTKSDCHISKSECELERLPTRSENKGLHGTQHLKVSLHDVKWLKMLEKLKECRKENGHCNVPQGYTANKKLGRWVHAQRCRYWLQQQGQHSSMSDERIAALESMGFKWSLAAPLKESDCHTSKSECELERLPARSENERLHVTKRRIQPSHDAKWLQMLEQLKEYRKENGHCNVSGGRSESKEKLRKWVSTQRTQYRLRKEGKLSSMTDERMAALQSMGFEWIRTSSWETRIKELQEYKANHGHCNVPFAHAENMKLVRWVHMQRRYFRLRQEGKKSPLTDERVTALESLGFQWMRLDWQDTSGDHSKDNQVSKRHISKAECKLKRLPTRSPENEGLQGTKRRKVSHDSAKWLQMLEKLKEYREETGRCNTPQDFNANKQLVNLDRRQLKLHELRREGKKSPMAIVTAPPKPSAATTRRPSSEAEAEVEARKTVTKTAAATNNASAVPAATLAAAASGRAVAVTTTSACSGMNTNTIADGPPVVRRRRTKKVAKRPPKTRAPPPDDDGDEWQEVCSPSAEKKPSIRGKADPRMSRAVQAKPADPDLSLYDALVVGGFDFGRQNDDGQNIDSVRKNNLCRRVRQAKTSATKSDTRKMQSCSPDTTGSDNTIQTSSVNVTMTVTPDAKHELSGANISEAVHEMDALEEELPRAGLGSTDGDDDDMASA